MRLIKIFLMGVFFIVFFNCKSHVFREMKSKSDDIDLITVRYENTSGTYMYTFDQKFIRTNIRSRTIKYPKSVSYRDWDKLKEKLDSIDLNSLSKVNGYKSTSVLDNLNSTQLIVYSKGKIYQTDQFGFTNSIDNNIKKLLDFVDQLINNYLDF